MTDTVAIVGGGITGLSAALTAVRILPESARVVLIESEGRLGGKIRTDHVGGALIEAGPDWFVTHRPEAIELCNELGLGDELVEPAASGVRLWSGAALTPAPPGFVRGLPTSAGAALRCEHLSSRGRLRALADLAWPRRLSGGDRSLGAVVGRHFGKEVLERLVDPMVAASRSGAADDMSLAAGAPEIDVAARTRRSVMRGLRANPDAGAGPGFLGLRGGMEGIITALKRALRAVEFHTNTKAVGLTHGRDGYTLEVVGGDTLSANAVVLAIPAFAASTLLQNVSADAAVALRHIEYSPAAVVGLVYAPDDVHPPPGASGFLVPTSHRRLLTACAWYSSKWPHASPPNGGTVLRCFAGEEASALDDDDLVDGAREDLATLAGVAADPSAAHVVRWGRALPVYAVGHLDRVAAARRALAHHPRLALAGAGYEGSGLPACIAQGREAAHSVVARA